MVKKDLKVGGCYNGRVVVELYQGTNRYFRVCDMVAYIYEHEDINKTEPLHCSVQTFLRAVS